MNNIKLVPLRDSDREQFILDNQEAFNYGALEEFGRRDAHFEEDEQIISRETIEKSIDNGEAYRIMLDGRPVGGVIISVDGEKGDLDILSPTIDITKSNNDGKVPSPKLGGKDTTIIGDPTESMIK